MSLAKRQAQPERSFVNQSSHTENCCYLVALALIYSQVE